MKRSKEKLKAIWHIITDKEYIVFTVTIKNNVRKRACALISDNASKIFMDSIIEFLPKYRRDKL